MAAAGRFITFEGADGTGKSTQARLLAERVRSSGREVVLTREPGGTSFAEAVRALILSPQTPQHGALSEALLFYAARADHLELVIRPALDRGAVVICDRFSDSTHVYQCLAGALPVSAFERLESLVVAPTQPQITFVLDLSAEAAGVRASARRHETHAADGPDAYERRDRAFQERLRAGFLQITREAPQRCHLIDANRPVEAIAEHIWRIASPHLTRKA